MIRPIQLLGLLCLCLVMSPLLVTASPPRAYPMAALKQVANDLGSNTDQPIQNHWAYHQNKWYYFYAIASPFTLHYLVSSDFSTWTEYALPADLVCPGDACFSIQYNSTEIFLDIGGYFAFGIFNSDNTITWHSGPTCLSPCFSERPVASDVTYSSIRGNYPSDSVSPPIGGLNVACVTGTSSTPTPVSEVDVWMNGTGTLQGRLAIFPGTDCLLGPTGPMIGSSSAKVLPTGSTPTKVAFLPNNGTTTIDNAQTYWFFILGSGRSGTAQYSLIPTASQVQTAYERQVWFWDTGLKSFNTAPSGFASYLTAYTMLTTGGAPLTTDPTDDPGSTIGNGPIIDKLAIGDIIPVSNGVTCSLCVVSDSNMVFQPSTGLFYEFNTLRYQLGSRSIGRFTSSSGSDPASGFPTWNTEVRLHATNSSNYGDWLNSWADMGNGHVYTIYWQCDCETNSTGHMLGLFGQEISTTNKIGSEDQISNAGYPSLGACEADCEVWSTDTGTLSAIVHWCNVPCTTRSPVLTSYRASIGSGWTIPQQLNGPEPSTGSSDIRCATYDTVRQNFVFFPEIGLKTSWGRVMNKIDTSGASSYLNDTTPWITLPTNWVANVAFHSCPQYSVTQQVPIMIMSPIASSGNAFPDYIWASNVDLGGPPNPGGPSKLSGCPSNSNACSSATPPVTNTSPPIPFWLYLLVLIPMAAAIGTGVGVYHYRSDNE